MPFSRSQNSKTAKKSAFILLDGSSLTGNKKVGRLSSSDFGALANQQIVTVLPIKLGIQDKRVKPEILGKSCEILRNLATISERNVQIKRALSRVLLKAAGFGVNYARRKKT